MFAPDKTHVFIKQSTNYTITFYYIPSCAAVNTSNILTYIVIMNVNVSWTTLFLKTYFKISDRRTDENRRHYRFDYTSS